ncbi:MAG: SUMF1/EgtB/PvdO family nonheme iron enzyme [Candidatus Micrarchaeota archaeon]
MKKILAVLLVSILLLGCVDEGASKATPTPKKPVATVKKPPASATAMATPSAKPTATPLPPNLRLAISKLVVKVNASNATVTWTTSNFSDAAVKWWKGNQSFEASNSTSSKSHSITIPGLSFRTAYRFNATSCTPAMCNSSTGSFDVSHRPCANGMAYFDGTDFCIDNYEAARSADGKIALGGGLNPWTMATRAEAQAACASAGKRLCTSAEFSAACDINGSRLGLIGDGECSLNGTRTYRTGEATDCISRAGVHDLIGNLREWVSDSVTFATPAKPGYANTGADALSLGAGYAFQPLAGLDSEKYGSDYYYVAPHSGKPLEGLGVTRGGDLSQGTRAGCFAYTVGEDPAARDPLIGFRCCS